MRIRVFQAFASNNSGSYTIVGSFESAGVAREVAALLAQVCAEHSSWHEEHSYDETGESPLDAFAETHGLSEPKPGRGDDWPQHGAPPTVLAVEHQVLVHAPYTVTMPKLLGEFFYKRGGRVLVELDHSHDELAVELSFYVPEVSWNDPEKTRRELELETKLREILPSLTQRNPHDDRPAIAPVFHNGFWGSKHLTVVFSDLVEGVEAVRAVAAASGVRAMVRVSECPHGVADPLAHLRSTSRPRGTSRVILWSVGTDRVQAMKAIREVLGTELAEVKESLEGLPKEVLVDVDHGYAERAAEVLRGAGCDAEAVRLDRS